MGFFLRETYWAFRWKAKVDISATRQKPFGSNIIATGCRKKFSGTLWLFFKKLFQFNHSNCRNFRPPVFRTFIVHIQASAIKFSNHRKIGRKVIENLDHFAEWLELARRIFADTQIMVRKLVGKLASGCKFPIFDHFWVVRNL